MKRAILGLLAAALLFPWVFRSRRGSFWGRMPLVAGGLGLLAASADPEAARLRPTRADLLTALGSAAGLYLVFQIGDRLARRIMPRGSAEIGQIYQLRTQAPPGLIALLLAVVIAPGEELFWRGLLQKTLAKRFGTVPGAALGALAYGGVHLGSGNLTLTGAAATAGAFWGAQYAIQDRLPALIVSHVLWDIWIFLIAPTQSPTEPST
jgi:membrane protease YdiL (CAAX protease family)